MMGLKRGMNRKKAVGIVLGAAVLILALLGLQLLLARTDASTREGRIAFLQKLGWEADPESEEHRSCLLSEEPDAVLTAYNRMQKAQGCDLSRHLGERCEIYSYRLTNYPDSGHTVLATLYVQGRRIIAGDIHSTALDGFMHALKAAH